jgi:hypothetical protein
VIGATPLAARDIQFVSAGDSAPAECAVSGAARSQDIAAACSDAYGADLLTLIEID